jgi:hypothetical protein
MIQLGDSRFVVPIATGLTPMWYTVPLNAPAGITRVNYMTMGITGGNQAAVLNVYITPLAMNLRADVPTLVLTYNIAAATRTSRVALGYDLLFYGGDYALIWEFTYSVAPATHLFGPCAAISPEAPMRLMSANSGAFNAALFTASTFPYGLPWCELYYCMIAAGEPVPPGEGGGGVPPVPTYTFAPAKLVAVL